MHIQNGTRRIVKRNVLHDTVLVSDILRRVVTLFAINAYLSFFQDQKVLLYEDCKSEYIAKMRPEVRIVPRQRLARLFKKFWVKLLKRKSRGRHATIFLTSVEYLLKTKYVDVFVLLKKSNDAFSTCLSSPGIERYYLHESSAPLHGT